MWTILIALRALAFATAFLLLWLWVAMQLHSLDRYLGAPLPEWTASVGILFIFIGGSLALTCVTLFIVQGRGTPAPFDAPRKLVAVGPYKVVRNPMYLGGLALLFGFGLYQYSKAILLFCPLWFLLAHAFVIFYEEATLMSKFGSAYHGYRKAVPRWIPRW
ncbi:MAG: isoprenylcysteine carboxylmethyltransferase family protein [Acidobacteria bacterium]|nr:isoprenylcysteine carboxylmethyltransferase family protein [Acidobacteriota bacterium]MCI0625477.1 isoprenylcysteine carboxylmethyltransferase family protein [Acidobacteriota bacterium]MCI0718554.1 isoprenylcysteine carboxylmethyltransferase family protein [Acidobacteriota bacterium]